MQHLGDNPKSATSNFYWWYFFITLSRPFHKILYLKPLDIG